MLLDDYEYQTSSEVPDHDKIYESLPVAQKVEVRILTLIMTRGKETEECPFHVDSKHERKHRNSEQALRWCWDC